MLELSGDSGIGKQSTFFQSTENALNQLHFTKSSFTRAWKNLASQSCAQEERIVFGFRSRMESTLLRVVFEHESII